MEVFEVQYHYPHTTLRSLGALDLCCGGTQDFRVYALLNAYLSPQFTRSQAVRISDEKHTLCMQLDHVPSIVRSM